MRPRTEAELQRRRRVEGALRDRTLKDPPKKVSLTPHRRTAEERAVLATGSRAEYVKFVQRTSLTDVQRGALTDRQRAELKPGPVGPQIYLSPEVVRDMLKRGEDYKPLTDLELRAELGPALRNAAHPDHAAAVKRLNDYYTERNP